MLQARQDQARHVEIKRLGLFVWIAEKDIFTNQIRNRGNFESPISFVQKVVVFRMPQ